MRVADLMTTDVHAVSASTSDTEALAAMEKWKIRHLPVLDDKRKVIGIVSDRDLHGAIATRRDRKIAELMTTPVHTIGKTALAHEAAAVMLTHRFSSLPVVDDAGVLVGVITNTDFVELARKLLQGLAVV